MRVPTGIKYGTLSFEENSGSINGIFDIFHCKNTVIGTVSADGKIYFAGEITTPMRTFAYEACGLISGESLSAEINGERISCTINGREVRP